MRVKVTEDKLKKQSKDLNNTMIKRFNLEKEDLEKKIKDLSSGDSSDLVNENQKLAQALQSREQEIQNLKAEIEQLNNK